MTALLLTASVLNAVLLLVAIGLIVKLRDELTEITSLDGSGTEATTATAQVVHADAPSLGVHHPSREALDSAENARVFRLRYENHNPY